MQIKAGSVINVLSVLITCVCLNTFMMPVYDMANIPAAFLANYTSPDATPLLVDVNTVNGTLAYNSTLF